LSKVPAGAKAAPTEAVRRPKAAVRAVRLKIVPRRDDQVMAIRSSKSQKRATACPCPTATLDAPGFYHVASKTVKVARLGTGDSNRILVRP
jgi:hypothetical protein